MIVTIEEAVGLLRRMVSIPSTSFHEDEVCGCVMAFLDAHGIVAERVGRNVVARSRSWVDGRKTLMMCAHLDTVPACDGYTFDPFTGEEILGLAAKDDEGGAKEYGAKNDEVVRGLGSNDDGGSVVAMVAAFSRYHDAELPVNLMLVLTVEEEVSGPDGMKKLWPETLDGVVDYAIVGEPTGMRAATSERGLLVLDGEAEGVSGHAARGEGVNAIYIALEDIDKIRNFNFDRVSPLMGRVHVNVTQIEAGTAHNVIPDKCRFVVDIRPTELYDNEEIVKMLQGVCRSRLTPRNLKNRSSATFGGSPLLRVVDDMGLESYSSPTTSDWMRISCDAVKLGPGESGRSHHADEFIKVSEIEDAVGKYVEFIKRFCDGADAME